MSIVHSKSAEAYDTAWGSFQDKWNEKYDRLVWYLDDTWLRRWKTRFVRAWTDRVMHFNTLVTSRAEGSHAVLKQALGTSSGDLLQVLDDIKLILTSQLAKHETEINLRRSRVMDHHNIEVYTHLKWKISPHALNLMLKQYDVLRTQPPEACSGVFRATTGLLCSHDMQRSIESGVLPTPDDIHRHWHLHTTLPPLPRIQDRVPTPEHAPDPVPRQSSPQLGALDHIRDPETIRGRSGRGGRGRGRGREPESSTRREYSLFEVIEHAVGARDRRQQQQASQSQLEDAVETPASSQRGRGRGGRRGRGGQRGQRGQRGRSRGQTQQQEEPQEQLAPDQEQLQMTLSQFANFAPVANRLSEMRARGQRGQRGQRARGAASYPGVPDGLIGSFQLASQ